MVLAEPQLTKTSGLTSSQQMCILARVMKKDIHPKNYRKVVFQDINNNWSFLTQSTVTAEETIKWEDGNEYPLVKVHISSSSHPFFTGQEKLLDIEGRVDKFEARRKAAEKARSARAASAKKEIERKQAKDESRAQSSTGGTSGAVKTQEAKKAEKQEAKASA